MPSTTFTPTLPALTPTSSWWQEAGGTVAEDVVGFLRQGEGLVVALAGGGVVGDQELHVGAANESS